MKNMKKQLVYLSCPSTSNCKHLNSVATKRLLDSRFNIVSAARHASSKVNATDLKFKITTLEFEELKSNCLKK